MVTLPAQYPSFPEEASMTCWTNSQKVGTGLPGLLPGVAAVLFPLARTNFSPNFAMAPLRYFLIASREAFLVY